MLCALHIRDKRQAKKGRLNDGKCCVLSLLRYLHPIYNVIDRYVRHWAACSG